MAYLEGKVEELSGGYGQLRQDIHGLDQKVDRFREELSRRIDALDQKFSRSFARHTGIPVTPLLAMLGVLGAALLR